MTTAAAAKFNMIEQQIRPWEVLDSRVLSTLNLIDRADFVADWPMPIVKSRWVVVRPCCHRQSRGACCNRC